MPFLKNAWDGPHSSRVGPVMSMEELVPVVTPEFRERLRRYREQYEQINGPTPCGLYTSMLPERVQEWMLADDELRVEYFNGLPPFMIDYFEMLAQAQASKGRLDDLSDPVVAVFIQNRGHIAREL